MNPRQLYPCRVEGGEVVAEGFRFRLLVDALPEGAGERGASRVVALAAAPGGPGSSAGVVVELFARDGDGLASVGRFPATWDTDADPVAVGDLVAVREGPFGLLRVSCPLHEALGDMTRAGMEAAQPTTARAIPPAALVMLIERRMRRFDPDGFDALARAARVIFPPETDVPTTVKGEPVH